MTTYVIDGYNLIHRAYPETLETGDLEAARAALQHRLERYQAPRRRACRILLVFDGERGVFGASETTGGVRVLFSRPPRSADDVILSLCRELEGEGDVRVVTSDLKDIALPLRGLRCSHVTSDAFAGMLARADGEEATSGEKPEAIDAGEVDDWLDAFGMRDEDDAR